LHVTAWTEQEFIPEPQENAKAYSIGNVSPPQPTSYCALAAFEHDPGVRGNILCIIAELVDGGVMMRDESIQFIQRGAQNRLVDF